LDALVDEIDSGNPAFGSNESQPPQQPQEPADPNAPPDPQTLEPPQHWPEEKKQLFRAQSPEAQQFLLERHKAMEGDYTRKTQELAQQAQAVAGLQGLGARLQQDPAFREHLQSYFQQQAQPNPQPAAGGNEEVDPIDQIENRAAEKAYNRIKQEQTVQAQRAQQNDFDMAYSRAKEIKAKDPLADKVQARLDNYVQAQKHPVRINETYAQLDSNPFFYLEMYRVMREELVAEQQQPATTPPANGGQRTVTPRAPNLERGGGAPVVTPQAEARKNRAERKKEALRSGSTEALGDFLDSAGLIDSLL
jgi:hypothetical protein